MAARSLLRAPRCPSVIDALREVEFEDEQILLGEELQRIFEEMAQRISIIETESKDSFTLLSRPLSPNDLKQEGKGCDSGIIGTMLEGQRGAFLVKLQDLSATQIGKCGIQNLFESVAALGEKLNGCCRISDLFIFTATGEWAAKVAAFVVHPGTNDNDIGKLRKHGLYICEYDSGGDLVVVRGDTTGLTVCSFNACRPS